MKKITINDEQIAAIGALCSLGESMGHEQLPQIVREFLSQVSKTYQVNEPFAMNRDTDRRVALIFGSKAAADEWMDAQRRQTITRDMSWDVAEAPKSCGKPLQGWVCTRGAGHEGPCATKPVEHDHGITSQYTHGISEPSFTRQSEAHKLLEALEPFMEALICYASTMDEHAGNRLAYEVERYFQNKDEYKKPLILGSAMTPFGLLCRAYRIAIGSSLYAQSQSTGIRPAALSAIEFGRRKMTDAELSSITYYFESNGLLAGQNFAVVLGQSFANITLQI